MSLAAVCELTPSGEDDQTAFLKNERVVRRGGDLVYDVNVSADWHVSVSAKWHPGVVRKHLFVVHAPRKRRQSGAAAFGRTARLNGREWVASCHCGCVVSLGMSAAFDAYLALTAVAASQHPSPVAAMFVHEFYDGIETGAIVLGAGDCFRVQSPDDSPLRCYRSFLLSRISESALGILPKLESAPPAFSWIDQATFLSLNTEETTEEYCCIGDPYLHWFVASPLRMRPLDLTFKSAHLLLKSKFRSTAMP